MNEVKWGAVSCRDLFIQFKSDPNYVRPGFHATFDFETANGTLVDTSGIIAEEFTPLETDESETNVVGKPGVEKRLQSGDFIYCTDFRLYIYIVDLYII